jgi:RND family efflux transporter MFP subunit
MKKALKIFIVLLVIIVLAVGGIRLLKKRKAEVANLPTPEQPVYIVKGAVAKKGKVVEKVKFLGKIVPEDEVYLSTKFSGNIEKMLVNEGDKIRKGQLIAKIDDSQIRLAIENLKINKEALESQLKGLKAQLESAKSDYRFVKTNYERDKKLFKGKAISEIQFLQSQTKLESAEAKVKSVESNINSLKDKINSIDKQIEMKKSDLKYLDIYSSVDGTVEKVLLKEGNLATKGKPLLKIQSHSFKILINFPDSYVGRIKKGTTALVDFNGIKQKLSITKIYPSADRNSLSVAEIKLNKLPKNTVSNSLVNVSLILKESKGIIVPKFAILHLTNGNFLITQKNGKFVKIPVEVIAEDEKFAVVKGNIQEGTPVAVAMESKLRLLAMGKKGKIVVKEGNNQ